MQSISNNVTALTGLAIAAIASVAVLLYVSIARDFLPGIVELTAALSAVVIFGAIALIPRGSRHAIRQRMSTIRVGRIGYVAASVAVLVITAVLAVLNDGFPWPAPLLLIVPLMAFAMRKTEGQT